MSRRKVTRKSLYRCVVESLENRRLLSASLASTNFIAAPLSENQVSGLMGSPAVTPDSTIAAPFDPAQIDSAYDTPGISFNGVVGTGAGQTIAIVDAYNDPDIVSDLNTFDSQWGLQAVNGAGDPTFQVLSQTGTTKLPANGTAGGWDVEESLDVEWAHAIAPDANIILYEASNNGGGLYTAILTARANPNVSVVSMSWSGGEFSGENSYDSTYFSTPSGHQGITFLASTGDSGEPSGYPAYSPDVVAVGGTTLTINSDNSWGGEVGWSDSGGGISTQESIPSYQKNLDGVNGSSTTDRNVPDVSMDADPNSGVYVLDTYAGGWYEVGGTSLSAPMWAGLIAITNQGLALRGVGTLNGGTQTLPDLYALPSSDFHDITSGNNGYAAGVGYDLVTGLGSPIANLLVPALAGYNSTSLSASQLAFNEQPSYISGNALSTVTVDVENSSGAIVTTDNSTVTLSLESGTGTLGGTISAAAVNGVATFNSLTINKAGNFSLAANDGSLTSAISNTFNVAQTINNIAVTPASPTLNVGATQQFSATAYDQFGNPMTLGSFNWSVTGGGSITSTGYFTAPALISTPTVKATSGGVNGTTTVNVEDLGPTVATSAAASPSPVTGTTTLLSVLGADPDGESTLTYTWSATSGPAAVLFSDNGDNTAKNATATFSKAGSYVLTATITDENNISTTSTVDVTVNQTLTNITVSPASPTLSAGGTQQFSATANDQFGNALTTQPSFMWTLTAGTGTLNSAGLYTAPDVNASATVQASSGGVNGSTTLTVTNHAPTVATAAAASPSTVTGKTTNLSVLGADDGGQSNLTYTWSASGPAAVTYSANGTNAAQNSMATFTKAGAYVFTATITDAGGLSVTSIVDVTVNQTVTKIVVTPSTDPTVLAGGTQQFTAAATDQFGNTMTVTPTWTTTGSANKISTTGLFTAGLSAGAYTVTATSGTVIGTAQVADNIFPSQADIGSPANAGSASFAASTGVYTVSGEGADIWGTSDVLHYEYTTLSGDGQIVAEVSSVGNTNAWAKSGVMIRNTLAANSAEALMTLTPGQGVAFIDRSGAGGSSVDNADITGFTAPYWVKLVRSGNTFTAFYSANGTSWTQDGPAVSISMSSTVYIGLAVASHTTNTISTSTFANVAITPYTDIAQGKVAAATSTAAGSSAANAVDGSTSTAWISAAGGSQTLTVNLGAIHSVSEIDVVWGSAYATSYTVQTSPDGSTWTTVGSPITTGKGGTVTFTNLQRNVQYVRITMTAGETSSDYSLDELDVLGF